MTPENLFRILTALTALGFGALWARNIASVGVSAEKFYTQTEGAALAVLRFFLLDGSLVGILVYVIAPDMMQWSAFSLPAWLRVGGFILSMGALVLFHTVLKALGRNFSTTLTIKADQTLVTEGPYRRVRHPMYTAFVSLWVGFTLLSANWFIGLSGLLGFAITMLVRTPREEQMMISRFGDEYRAYMQRTGRYLPRRLSKE